MRIILTVALLVLTPVAIATAADLGLPPLVPAGRLYRLLIEHGHPAPADTRTNLAKARAAASWLPLALRGSVLDVLVAGNRLAQEAGHLGGIGLVQAAVAEGGPGLAR